MRFLLVGHGGCYNRGCEAILRTTMSLVRQEFPAPEIVVSSFDYKKDKKCNFDDRVHIIPARKQWDRYTPNWLFRQIRKGSSKNYRLDYWKTEYRPIIPYIKRADVVLSVGGDNYTLNYGYPEYFFKLNKLVKEFKSKLVIWAASIGPFSEAVNIEEIVNNLKLADLITVREPSSYRYLQNIGVTKNIRLVQDPAFLLQVQPVPMDKLIPQERMSNLLGINISPFACKYNDNNRKFEVISEITHFLKNVITRLKFHVVLISHVVNERSVNNDHVAMAEIYDHLKNTDMITQIKPNYNAMETKFIISKCRFFIGARTHSTIAALSMGVPTLSLSYSLKSIGINESIFGHQDYLLDVGNLTSENLYGKFEKILREESTIHDHLRQRMKTIKSNAEDNIRFLKTIV